MKTSSDDSLSCRCGAVEGRSLFDVGHTHCEICNSYVGGRADASVSTATADAAAVLIWQDAIGAAGKAEPKRAGPIVRIRRHAADLLMRIAARLDPEVLW